ncbi:protein DCL homolog, chloroplastic [Telopea speciosissima]|uniref:protein DCL homolog, chloroplastic n=1 Tax=Telopea speciosissima TaxID=54955 RepID=UPI001CC6FD45|nr:protein DCL homolog, chloroplastic [Telopea speciosissima]
MAAAPLLLRGIPRRLSLTLQQQSSSSVFGFFVSVGRPSICTAAEFSQSLLQSQSQSLPHDDAWSAKDALQRSRLDSPDYRQWKDREAEILHDIKPITSLAKEIIHSDKYMDGERLTPDDEKAVVEKLLAFHPHSEDKIGCGLDSIMVDRHPQFRCSRCLFVVRTDGGWIDFSYQKCLRAYIQDKYPSHAERFISKHFKRGSG